MALPINQLNPADRELISSMKAQSESLSAQGRLLHSVSDAVISQKRDYNNLRKDVRDLQKTLLTGTSGISELKRKFDNFKKSSSTPSLLSPRGADKDKGAGTEKGFFASMFSKLFGPSKIQTDMYRELANIRDLAEKQAEELSIIRFNFSEGVKQRDRVLLASAIANAIDREGFGGQSGGGIGLLLGGIVAALGVVATQIVSAVTGIAKSIYDALYKLFEGLGWIKKVPGAVPVPGPGSEGNKPGAPGKPGGAAGEGNRPKAGSATRPRVGGRMMVGAGVLAGLWATFVAAGSNLFGALEQEENDQDEIDKIIDESLPSRDTLKERKRQKEEQRTNEGIIQRQGETREEFDRRVAERRPEGKAEGMVSEDLDIGKKIEEKLKQATEGFIDKLANVATRSFDFIDEGLKTFGSKYREVVEPQLNNLLEIPFQGDPSRPERLQLFPNLGTNLGNAVEDAYSDSKNLMNLIKDGMSSGVNVVTNNVNNIVPGSKAGDITITPPASSTQNTSPSHQQWRSIGTYPNR